MGNLADKEIRDFRSIIDLEQLDQHVEAALSVAWDFDIDPADLRLYLSEIHRLFTNHC